jgi:lantibiotic modifying enzyme
MMSPMSREGGEGCFRRLLEWVETVGVGPTTASRRCSCVDDVVAFHERLGGYLALLYAIGVTDVREEHLVPGAARFQSFDVAALLPVCRTTCGEPGARGVARDLIERSVFRLGSVVTRSPPVLRGQPVGFLSFREDIVRGFERMYVVLWRNRERLTCADGPIGRGVGDGEVRSRGLPIAVSMAIEQRLEGFGAMDLARQRWLLRASFVSFAASESSAEQPRRVLAGARVGEASERGRFVRAACVVAERLEALAVETQCEATWLGLVPDARAEGRWAVRPLGIDLHSGLAGVVWFLGRLSHVTGDGRWRRLAGRAAQGWVAQASVSGRETCIGAFAGWGGLVFVAAHLFSLWRERVWLERAAGWRARILEFLSLDRDVDLSSGAAGAILGLAALQAVERTELTCDAIRACAEHLLARAPPRSAGVVLGLAVAATETGDARYAKASHRGAAGGASGFVPGLSIAWPQSLDQWKLGDLERLVSRGMWRCATPWGLETPGLILGLAGVGDRLLRVAEPSLPGLLGLEAPRLSRRF